MRGFMLRRTKYQVAAELTPPPCVREDKLVELSFTQHAMYRRIVSDYRRALRPLAAERPREEDVGRTLRLLTALRQACCLPGMGHSESSVLRDTAGEREALGRLILKVRVHALLASTWNPPVSSGKLHHTGHPAGSSQDSKETPCDHAFCARMLSMQANAALDATLAAMVEARTFSVAAAVITGQGSDFSDVMEHLCDVMLLRQLATLYDVREAAKYRGGKFDVCLREELMSQVG